MTLIAAMIAGLAWALPIGLMIDDLILDRRTRDPMDRREN